jgi:hypothetical protein
VIFYNSSHPHFRIISENRSNKKASGAGWEAMRNPVSDEELPLWGWLPVTIPSRKDAADSGLKKATSSEAGYEAWRHPIGNEVSFLWERLSASMIAAGKPLPRG